ncbi:polysaccharide deacetylase family protein [Pseudaestuariivita atlantica]|uniref:Chitooligosaccharide deacetylase n=1 Tax=Pseudaestuariivita atlantica TaxID=1317121 RepID=A0A0L1JN13_9RHOB|nr:polysaccharide deacetylase [Pseudaestuariivita atlantica]KNG93097.1 ribulose-phosphate 3-epimerase [Pseudaestuariivita atlantica]
MIRNPIPWPNGARCACAITFDMDADSLIHVARPEDSSDRLYPISMGRYGPEVAIPRILATYRRLGIKQSFFIPGWCMQTYPRAVEMMLEDGHEIGHHGWIHEDPIVTRGAAQEEAFEKALEVHKRMTGKTPRGYRAPVYNITLQVVDLLVKHDFRYDSSMMGDDVPYRLQTAQGSLYEMPVHWGTDDWPPFAHYDEIGYMMPVRGPSAGLGAFWEEFEAQYEAGGFFMLIVHPFLTGRLARWRLVEQWLELTLAERDVWFAPLEAIADHLDTVADLRTDHLPYYDGPQS